MKNILCYGDSNTWGYTPGTKLRYPENVRWTGVAQTILGSEYRLIEEAISGRTTVFDDPFHEYWNGKTALGYAILASYPLDLMIIFLGTNDLKYVNAADSARGLATLLHYAKNASTMYASFTPAYENDAKVLVVSPITLHRDIEKLNPGSSLSHAYEESTRLAEAYKKVADEAGAYFLDAAEYAYPSDIDGVHLTPEGHKAIGTAIANKISEIL